jgi:hypothetical protein
MNLDGLYSLILGVCLVLFHRQFARWSVKFYDKFKIGHVSEKGYWIGYLLIGILFAVVGLFELF